MFAKLGLPCPLNLSPPPFHSTYINRIAVPKSMPYHCMNPAHLYSWINRHGQGLRYPVSPCINIRKKTIVHRNTENDMTRKKIMTTTSHSDAQMISIHHHMIPSGGIE